MLDLETNLSSHADHNEGTFQLISLTCSSTVLFFLLTQQREYGKIFS